MIQRQIFSALSPAERFQRGLEQIEETRQMVESSVRKQYPQASEAEFKEQVFRRYYSHDLPPVELEAACEALRRYWESRLSETDTPFLDLAGEAVGGKKNCPPDLSNNPEHMQGFGH